MRNEKQQNRKPISSHFKAEKKIKEIKNKDGKLIRKRVQKCFKKSTSMFKSEYAKETDINNIIKYPMDNDFKLTYADLTNKPNLEEVFATVNEINENFHRIPSNVRKLIDNDASRLQELVTNKDYEKVLISSGVLIPRDNTSSKASGSLSGDSKAKDDTNITKDVKTS